MNVWRGSGEFLVWLSAVIWHYTKTDPWRTWVVIGSSIGQKISTLLAFFLPLKVILLLGSDGVPRYFRGFITPESRDEWIFVLAGAAVVFYLLSILLERTEERHAVVSSGRVLREATQLAIINSQNDVAKDFYIRLCRTASSLILSVFLMTVIGYFYPSLCLFLITLLAVEYAWSVGIIALANSRKTEYFSIVSNPNSFFTIVSSINFLMVFGFLVIEFTVLDGVNILVAILSVLVTRLLFTNLSLFISEGIRLTRVKEKINMLVFTDHQMRWQDTAARQRFRNHFGHEERIRRVAKVMRVGEAAIASSFTDRGPQDVWMFELSIHCGTADPSNFIEMVFSPSKFHLIENEDTLFEHVGPDKLSAARLLYQYEVDCFVGRIYEGGTNATTNGNNWKQRRRDFLVNAWKTAPPKRIEDIFRAARPLLHERISSELIEGLEFAIDTTAEKKAYTKLLASLPELGETISSVPLFILNPRLGPGTLLHSDDCDLALNWGNWTLAPIGAGLESGKDAAWLKANFPDLIARAGLPKDLDCGNIELCMLTSELERRIHEGRLKEGVRLLLAVANILEDKFPKESEAGNVGFS